MSKNSNDTIIRDQQARAAQQAKAAAKKAKKDSSKPRNRVRDTFAVFNKADLVKANEARLAKHSLEWFKDCIEFKVSDKPADAHDLRSFHMVAFKGDRVDFSDAVIDKCDGIESMFARNWVSKLGWAIRAKLGEAIAFTGWPDGVDLNGPPVTVYVKRAS